MSKVAGPANLFQLLPVTLPRRLLYGRTSMWSWKLGPNQRATMDMEQGTIQLCTPRELSRKSSERQRLKMTSSGSRRCLHPFHPTWPAPPPLRRWSNTIYSIKTLCCQTPRRFNTFMTNPPRGQCTSGKSQERGGALNPSRWGPKRRGRNTLPPPRPLAAITSPARKAKYTKAPKSCRRRR